MDNQQERPLSIEFIAGLIVGEGSFSLAVQRVKHRVKITPFFYMQMKDRETILSVYDTLTMMGMSVYTTYEPKYPRQMIRANGFKKTKRLLDVLLPHLTGTKLLSARLVNEFIESREKRSKFDPYTDHEIELVQRLRATNGVPGKKTTSVEGLVRSGGRHWRTRLAESSETTRSADVSSV